MGGVRGRVVLHRLQGFLPTEVDGTSKGPTFLCLFLKAQRRIFAYILTLLPHLADAEDVLQEVSMIMWEKFDERNPPEDFIGWGCRIAYYRVRQHDRGRRRQRVIFSEDVLERVAETMAEESIVLQLDERLEALVHCLGKLGRRDRELISERFKEGATPHAVAESIGRSVDTVYKAMARIRKALYDCVERTLDAEGRS
jgi:RNA polymerase sigma-70 factor, ECF subfamily